MHIGLLARVCLYTNQKAYVDYNLTFVSRLKDFSKSQAVMCSEKAVLSRKRYTKGHCYYTSLIGGHIQLSE